MREENFKCLTQLRDWFAIFSKYRIELSFHRIKKRIRISVIAGRFRARFEKELQLIGTSFSCRNFLPINQSFEGANVKWRLFFCINTISPNIESFFFYENEIMIVNQHQTFRRHNQSKHYSYRSVYFSSVSTIQTGKLSLWQSPFFNEWIIAALCVRESYGFHWNHLEKHTVKS